MKKWTNGRRQEIFKVFESEVFGKAPAHPKAIHFKLLKEDKHALNNTATRIEVAVYLTKDEKHYMTILMYVPNNRKEPVPMSFGPNFRGSLTVSTDPGITESAPHLYAVKASEPMVSETFKRGFEASRWPIEMLIAKGYAVSTFYRGDIDFDYDDGFKTVCILCTIKKGKLNLPQ